ncbi:MAG: LSU ribosomal protein L17p, partial [uncultured Gemmatimonadetes bacterium]
ETRKQGAAARAYRRAPYGDAAQHGHEPVPPRPHPDHDGQGQGAASVRGAADHAGAQGRPSRHPPGRAPDPGPRGAHAAVQADRAPLRGAQRWLHPRAQDGLPPGRRRRDGADRAGGPRL